MTKKITAPSLILAFVLATFSIGYTYAHNKVVVVPLGADTSPTSFAVFAEEDQAEIVEAPDEVVVSVAITAPVDGVVIVNSSNAAEESTAADGIRCSITTASAISTAHLQFFKSAGVSGNRGQMSGTRGFNIQAGQTITYNLVCSHFGMGSASSTITNSSLTAIFTPAQS